MVKSIVNTLSTKFLSAVFSFLILLITSNYLGSEGRGQISLLIASITIVLLIANFVGGNTLIYLTPRKPIGELLLVSYLWSFLTILATFSILTALHAFEFQTCLHISVLSLLFSLSSVHISILYGKENIETANKINLFQVVAHFFILSACFLVFDFKNIDTFIYSLYFTYLMTFILSAYSIKKYINSPFSFKLKGTIRMAFSLGAIAQLANIFQFLNYRLDVYLLNKYDSIANLGIYSTTVAIAESVLLLGGSFALVQFSKISNTEDAGQSIAITTKLTRLSTLLSIMAYLPLFVFPDEFYSFLLGKDFHQVRSILFALAPGIIFLGSSVTLSHHFAGTGNYKINAMASLCGLAITFTVGLVVIPTYGFIAAAWVSSFSYFVSTLILVIVFLRQTKTKFSALLPNIADLKFLQKSILNVRDKRNS